MSRKNNANQTNNEDLIEVPDYPTSFDPKRSKKPKLPLTKEEIAKIFEEKFEECVHAYSNRTMKSGLLGIEDEDNKSMRNSAYLFFMALTSKFDKSFYGEIGDKDIDGKNSPKTLGWYFYNYFTGKVNENAKEQKDKRKKHRDLYGSDIDHEWVIQNIPAERAIEYRQFYDMLMVDAQKHISIGAITLMERRFLEGASSKEAKKMSGHSYYALRNEMMNYLNIFMLRKRTIASTLFGVTEVTFFRRIQKRLRGRSMQKIMDIVDQYSEPGDERDELKTFIAENMTDPSDVAVADSFENEDEE